MTQTVKTLRYFMCGNYGLPYQDSEFVTLEELKAIADMFNQTYFKAKELGDLQAIANQYVETFITNGQLIIPHSKKDLYKSGNCVYFIQGVINDKQSVHSPLVKIGATNNVLARAQTLASKYILATTERWKSIIFIIKTDEHYFLERSLQRIFAHRKVENEWFNLSDSDIQHIKSLAKENS